MGTSLRSIFVLSVLSTSSACGFIGLESAEGTAAPSGKAKAESKGSSESAEADVVADDLAQIILDSGDGKALDQGDVDSETDLIGFGGASGFCVDSETCLPADALIFGDDFEAGELSENSFNEGLGTLEVTNRKSKAGAFSMYATYADEEGSESGMSHFLPREIEELYFSSWVFLPEKKNSGAMQLLAFFNETNVVELWLNSSSQLELSLDEGAVESVKLIRYGRWSCLRVQIITSNNMMQVAVDFSGSEHLFYEEDNLQILRPFDRVEYGLLAVEEEEQVSSIYWDNVAVSREPIDCLKGQFFERMTENK